MRCKIGKLFVSNHRFPIWIVNRWGVDIFEINIYCDSNVVDILMDSLDGRNFFPRFSGDTKTVAFKINSRKAVERELHSLAEDEKLEINFKKLDDFFLKVDKEFVVKRLS